jgi:hypothetical protein
MNAVILSHPERGFAVHARRGRWICGYALLTLLLLAAPAHAHVGNKDVFEQVSAGPYKLFVTVRTPTVIPGVATVEVRASPDSGARVNAIRITPVPLTGEASTHPPTSDAMQPSPDDPAFFTGSLWLMASGSWQVRLEVAGSAGAATAGVPVPAVPLSILPMQRPLALTLAALAIILMFGMAGIVGAAVRESRLAPGVGPTPARRRAGLVAGLLTFGVAVLSVVLGGWWWKVEAAAYAADIYHPSDLHATLTGDTLDLSIGNFNVKQSRWKPESVDELLLDHGHLMHLYAIRMPGMDAAFHLHPAPVGEKRLSLNLPAMPPGDYKLYADIVRLNGFPETLTATLTVPAGLPAAPLGTEDAEALPSAIASGDLGPSYKLPDGYTMVWDRPAEITANTAYLFLFRLLDSSGQPATDMQPYLGMAGHAAFVKDDFSTFAHTHPDGSAAMPAVMLANPSMGGQETGAAMAEMPGIAAPPQQSLPPVVEFPYGFPSPGRYRIFIQMKHGGTVETGVFDAEVR